MYLDEFIFLFDEFNMKKKNTRGCTDEEIAYLEKRIDIILPTAYKEFLLWGGYEPQFILGFSDCSLKDLIGLQEFAIDLLKDNNFPISLPKDAFIFCLHQGYQFLFFRCSEGDNPPVYSYIEYQETISFNLVASSFSQTLMDIITCIKRGKIKK